ncbi:hypothetical protein [Clostridium sp. HBUAS56017]|uniref:hypothetical protein n=1 Tax=Clostridium sp. HBUAS56017 TaxID=2571128 RepID=UPI0011775CDB|nr:hypothetical protein [Clostridium sp. HBUAS56017]
MGKVKYNIYYGQENIENIVDKMINERIIQITQDIKRGEIARYNDKLNKNLSTDCKKNQEVGNK